MNELSPLPSPFVYATTNNHIMRTCWLPPPDTIEFMMLGDTKSLDIEQHDNRSLFRPMSGTAEGRWRDLAVPEEPRSSDKAKGANKAILWYNYHILVIFP
jgi:hypothetical protein